MPPYVVAKEFESSQQFADMKRLDPAKARRFWTPSRVAALKTEEIVARLLKLGIDGSQQSYLALTTNRTSAWDLSAVWRNNARTSLSQFDDDFVGLAACELWKRYCADRPSIEMLDDWMQEGYRFMMDGYGPQACDRWSEVWSTIRSRVQPEMRTCDSASIVFYGTQDLFNWVQDFALELHNAALDDPRYADTGVELCEDVLTQFPDEDHLFRLNFRADLGEFYYLAGRPEHGERVLLELIHDEPNLSAGYARLANILAYGVRQGDQPIDHQRAIHLLEEALAKPVSDPADYDLKARLEELRNAKKPGLIKDEAAADP